MRVVTLSLTIALLIALAPAGAARAGQAQKQTCCVCDPCPGDIGVCFSDVGLDDQLGCTNLCQGRGCESGVVGADACRDSGTCQIILPGSVPQAAPLLQPLWLVFAALGAAVAGGLRLVRHRRS